MDQLAFYRGTILSIATVLTFVLGYFIVFPVLEYFTFINAVLIVAMWSCVAYGILVGYM